MDFIQQYFIDPVVQGTGYNIYNTLAYAVILMIAVFGTYKLLKKFGIRIDNKFYIGVLPYVILGGLLRALEDASIVQGFWFKTPIIYIIIFAVAFVALFISKISEKIQPLEYWKIWGGIGFALVIAGLVQITVRSAFALEAIVSLSVFWALLLLLVKKLSEKKSSRLAKFFTWENTAILWVHMFDATTTFVAIQYFPYFEQHVLPSFLIGIFGPAIMFVLKFAVVAAVLYVLDKEMKAEKEKKKFIKLVVLILGLAPGLRNAFRLIMGV